MNIIKPVSLQTDRTDCDNLEYNDINLSPSAIEKMSESECHIVFNVLMNQREFLNNELTKMNVDKSEYGYYKNASRFKKIKKALDNKKKLIALLQKRFSVFNAERKANNIRIHAIDNHKSIELFKQKVKALIGNDKYMQLWYEIKLEMDGESNE